MFNKESLDFLERFMKCSSPSGYEVEAAKCYREYLKPYCAEVRGDVLGNSIAVLNPKAKFKVMLAGHYDEIGFQIVYISDEGLLYFRPNGGIDTLNIPASILTESSLSFLGLGIQPPNASWGLMINTGRQYLYNAPWLCFAPGAAIMLTVLAFNFLGNGLLDVLDPRMQKQ